MFLPRLGEVPMRECESHQGGTRSSTCPWQRVRPCPTTKPRFRRVKKSVLDEESVCILSNAICGSSIINLWIGENFEIYQMRVAVVETNKRTKPNSTGCEQWVAITLETECPFRLVCIKCSIVFWRDFRQIWCKVPANEFISISEKNFTVKFVMTWFGTNLNQVRLYTTWDFISIPLHFNHHDWVPYDGERWLSCEVLKHVYRYALIGMAEPIESNAIEWIQNNQSYF